MFVKLQNILYILTALIYLFLICSVNSEKYKLCVVDGRGFKRAARYCPILDKPDSKVECILGTDRLDCLRKISKEKADFAILTPEDLVTAINSEIEVLLTNELRYTKDKFEYEIVAVISDSSRIKSKHDLRNKRFCHPGYGYEAEWTKILANYLEASVIPQSCLTKFTITENRIKASSEFFKSACKAGPWVNNQQLDQELKTKYPNLCALCDNPFRCETSDKYWGRRGSLFCLTDGAGDISWARLDDVRVHFGLVGSNPESPPNGYSFLCPDGKIIPVNSTDPCVWVVKPWPVIASRRTVAQEIRDFITTLSASDSYSWQSALLNLIEIYYLSINKLEPLEPIETFLEKAPGYLSANSFTGCHPPRTIRICTTSILENAKCLWLRESATVYGIEPDLDCVKADNTTHCMKAVNNEAADVVMVPPDLFSLATKQYNLITLFYETVNDNEKYLTVAVTRKESVVKRLEDLQGYSACFPNWDGVAWNTMIYTLHKRNLIKCQSSKSMANFFGPSCVPGLSQNESKSLTEKCGGNYHGDFGALRCLLDGNGDVAFLSKNSISEFIHSPVENKYGKIKLDSFNILCENKSEGCHLSWSAIGQAMVRNSSTVLWMKDSLDVFLQLDNLFGKDYKTLTTPIQLFGPFNGKPNVLFHDDTVRFRNVPTARNIDNMQRIYQNMIDNNHNTCSSSTVKVTSPFLIIIVLFTNLFLINFQ